MPTAAEKKKPLFAVYPGKHSGRVKVIMPWDEHRRKKLRHARMASRAVVGTSTVTARSSWRYRAALAPWLWAAVVAAGLGVATFTSHTTVARLVVAAVVAVAAVAAADRVKGADARRIAVTALSVAALWVAVVAFTGVASTPARLSGLAIWLAASLPWWDQHRFRGPTVTTEAASDIAVVWAKRVATRTLPGTQVVESKPLTVAGEVVGTEVVIEAGDDTDVTTSGMVAKTEAITGRLKLPVGSVAIDATEEGHAHRARCLILTRNPLRNVQRWYGSDLDLDAGTSSIGPYADGSLAPYVWVMPGSGPWHDLIAGTTGAGKSRLIEMLLAISRQSAGAIVDWVGDPQEGQSCPDWIDHVDRSARTAEECVLMLERAVQAMYARNRYLASYVWTDGKGRERKGFGYFPWMSIGMPLLVVTIFEAHAVLNHPTLGARARAACEEIGKMARKCGIKLRLEVQVPLLDQLGNSTTIRSMVASGNVVVFRTADRLTSQVAFNGALPVDPASIPKAFPGKGPIADRQTGGMGYTLGAASSTMPFRAWMVEDSLDVALTGRTWGLDEYTQENAGTWPPLPEHLAAAIQVRQQQITAESDQSGTASDQIMTALRGGPQFFNDLITATGKSRSTVYAVLKALREAGTVRDDEAGRVALAQESEPV